MSRYFSPALSLCCALAAACSPLQRDHAPGETFVPVSTTETALQDTTLRYTPLLNQNYRGAAVGVEPIAGQRPVAVRTDDGFAVLDARFGQIVLLRTATSATAGKIRIAIPETQDPHAIARVNDDLWVLDRSRALLRYRLRGDSLRLLARITLRHRAEELCAMAGKIYVRGRDSSGFLVHMYSAAGEHVGDFGRAIDAPDQLFRDQLSRGSMRCDSASDRVLISFDVLPEARLYRGDGILVWSKLLPPLKAMAVEAGWDPEPYVARDYRSSWDQVWSVLSDGSDVVGLCGVAYTQRAKAEFLSSPWCMPLRLRDGTVGVKSYAPSIPLAERDGALVRFQAEPTPALFLETKRQ